MKPSFLRIFQEVNTKDGRGILVNIETPFNGLYVDFYRAKCVVWFGMENAVCSGYGGKWVSREYPLSELEECNKDLKLDNTLSDLGI
jgi:hypothetical protein